MSATAELDVLLSRLVDDQLDDADSARLQDVLRADATARRRYRQVMALHAGLQWDYVAAARTESPLLSSPRRRLPWIMPMALAATLMAAFLLPSVWAYLNSGDTMLTVVTVSDGSLTWSTDDNPHTLVVGDQKTPGWYYLKGDGATATLQFADGTSVTLIGDTALRVVVAQGKHLHLQQGLLVADVRAQPVADPLVIQTTTAEIQVVGTRFTVNADDQETALEVDQGKVRLERLVDGQVVEVGEQYQATATLDTARPLVATLRPQIASNWRTNFNQRPPGHWSGTWVAPVDGSLGLFAAMPYVAGRDANGRPFIHHGVRIESIQGANRSFVRLHGDSRLTMHFRMMRGDSRTQVKVMLCMKRDNGSFGGTFFASVDPQAIPADAEGWRTAVLAMSAFVPTRPTVHPSPIGNSVTFILANTAARPAGLEVASLAVDLP